MFEPRPDTNDGNGVATNGWGEGMGLEIMRYRARLIGATLMMSRTTAGGTRIRCHLPNLNAEPSTIKEDERDSDSDCHSQ
jgi:glucose-6-phosphate-specific signal transduction histidine kinase